MRKVSLDFLLAIFLFFLSTTQALPGTTPGIPPPASSPPPTISPPVLPPSTSSSAPATPSALSQEDLITEGREAFRSGDYRRTHDLIEEALLDSGPSRLPPEAILELASSNRRIGHPGRAIALLLPLLGGKGSAGPLNSVLLRRVRYELAMADRDKDNLRGAVHQLLPVFPDLTRSSRIRHATGVLLDHWKSSDPVSGGILMGQALNRLAPPDQKVVMTRTIDLIFNSVRDEGGLMKILSVFPRDFPGDYAAYRLALLEARSGHPRKSERMLLRMLLYYPESLYVSEAEHLLNSLSMGGKAPSVGLILPDLSRGALGPYMRSILAGAVLGLPDGTPGTPGLIVRFVTGRDTYGRWYGNLVERERVGAILGPFLAKDLASVRSRLVPDQILAVTPTLPADPGVRFMISMASSPEMVARALSAFSLTLFPKPRVAILYPTDYYGKRVRDSFVKALRSSGGKVTAAIPLPPIRGKRQAAVLRLRRFGQDVTVPPKGPYDDGITGRSGDFVTYAGKSYYLVYPPDKTPGSRPVPFFFKPDFDIIAFPNDSRHPFKVLDELVYKDIQNVDVLGNESLMMVRRQWDMVSDIHNPLYSVAPVNLFHAAKGNSRDSVLREAYHRLIQVTGRSPDLLEIESYDCAAFLSTLFREGFRTRYHLGVTALAKKSYNGLSGPVSWGPDGAMSRVYTLYRFSGGDWKMVSTQMVSIGGVRH
ncbi:MAG: ABC transporter substrate-binding protein [Nitrospirae bacterium]|nr:ABC transporter substrate-binding protein [Nitrospirota bacterium]MCL5285102.1 ABC transporter substrate-binding protein [Nitrospirota bacterium]